MLATCRSGLAAEPAAMTRLQRELVHYLDVSRPELIAVNQDIWTYAELGLEEYRSAARLVGVLKKAGFRVREGVSNMPTAFVARFRHGDGPVIGAYSEYDAVPGNCQAAATRKMPRPGLSRHAAGHTDPHSALGIGALGGASLREFGYERLDKPQPPISPLGGAPGPVFAALLAQMDAVEEEIDREHAKGERLKLETEAIRARIDATLARIREELDRMSRTP